INMFMTRFSTLPAKQPYFDTTAFPELQKLTENWQVIREEALRLQHHIKAAQANNDAGFNTFFKRGWKRFYLKWYSDAHPSAETLCPITTKLVNSIPSIKAAMFAELPPGAYLGKHRDPYAGSVRYHLGLSTPNDDRCFIEVDRQRHSWRDGEAVIFDETYVHWAENKTEQTRIILFCDIERPMKWRWAQSVNHWVGASLMSAASSPNDENDRTGAINRIFKYVHAARDAGQRLKKKNRTLYYALKYLVIAAIFAAIILFSLL
ncbi:aspartyl/asparaginyl beta-hydroxylase domain-containing protein, partial [Salmonella enterica subsp. enterica serovar Infantis]